MAQRAAFNDPVNMVFVSIDKAGINPETISYVESAANGSVLGDPIEVIALTNAFSQYTDKKRFCALGSVKSNLGHLEAASGMSQLANSRAGTSRRPPLNGRDLT